MEISKQVAFSGLEKFFPKEMQAGMEELVRRLENFGNSVILNLRVAPTVFTGDDVPEGMKQGDAWLRSDHTYLIYDGSNWS